MAKYLTEQRKELMSFFSQNPDKQFSAQQIATMLEGKNISLSAVYRNLDALEESGVLLRSLKDGCHETYYRYIGNEGCKNSIHMICLKCGATLHIAEKTAESLLKTLSDNEEFSLDKSKTTLYGFCKGCR